MDFYVLMLLSLIQVSADGFPQYQWKEASVHSFTGATASGDCRAAGAELVYESNKLSSGQHKPAKAFLCQVRRSR